MGKFASDTVMDAALGVIDNATRLVVCSGQPANFAGIAAVALADVVVDSGDFTIADGDISGRKVTIGAQTSIPVDATGTATHVCLDNGSTLLYVTTCPSIALTSGGTVSVPAFDIEVGDAGTSHVALVVADALHVHAVDHVVLSAGGGSPVWAFDPSDYADFAELAADSPIVMGFDPGETGDGLISLGTGTIYGGGTGKYLVHSYAGGSAQGISTYLEMPAAMRGREVWIEAETYFDDGWTGVTDDKTIFVMQDKPGIGSQVDRWDVYLKSGNVQTGGANNLNPGHGPFPNPLNSENEIWDGQWHLLRLHFYTPWNSETTGIYEVWWDDHQFQSVTGFTTPSTPTDSIFRVLILGGLADPSVAAARRWGRIRGYTSDPGW